MSLKLTSLRLPLARFTLEVDAELAGHVTGIFGPSGSGKTSLLDLVAGLRRPQAGAIALDGRELTRVPARERRIGYVPQDGALFPHLTVRRNILYGYRRRESQNGFGFDHVVAALEIEPLLDREPASLSGGENRRVALARALLSSPRLLLLDEPMAGLDFPLRARILPTLRRVRDEFRVPMLYVAHDPDEVMALCDEVLVLDQGRVRARGKPADLFTVTKTETYQLK